MMPEQFIDGWKLVEYPPAHGTRVDIGHYDEHDGPWGKINCINTVYWNNKTVLIGIGLYWRPHRSDIEVPEYERVARAMCAALGKDPDEMVPVPGDFKKRAQWVLFAPMPPRLRLVAS